MSARSMAFAGLFALVLGCGGGAAIGEGAETVAPPPPLTGDALLPSECFLVAKLDLIRLRESANWDVFENWVSIVEENISGMFPSLAGGELRRWVSLTDRVWVGLAPSDDPTEPDVFTVVEGRFEGAAFGAALAGLGGDQPMFTPIEGASVPTLSGDESIGDVAILADGLLVSATSGRVSEVVQRHDSREGQSPLAGAEMETIAQRVNFARDPIGVAAVFTPEAKAALESRLTPEARMVLDVSTAGALRVGLNEGIDALAVATTNNALIAAGGVRLVQQRRDALRREPFALMLGLGPLFDGIGAQAEGTDLRVSLRLSQEEARSLMERAGGFIGLGLSAMIGERTRARPAPSVEVE
jgi:hypothetical protein